jgi:hypothetical protein
MKFHYKTSFLNFDHDIFVVQLMCNRSCLENKRQELFILASRRKKKLIQNVGKKVVTKIKR